jgi:predicted deacetylase
MSHRDIGRSVAFVVHDVAPRTWTACAQLLQMLDDLGAQPVTILVVPHYHYQDPIAKDARFVAALDRRLARGDEIALHGFHHRDDEPPPRTLRGFVERRILTRAEGEFAALNEAAAAWRLAQGIDVFRALRWPLYGFVPPAWLLGEPSRAAIDRCGYPLRYVSARRGIFRLPHWRFARTANVWYSPDARWRRMLSRALIRAELARAHHRSLLRVSLHPQDVHCAEVLAHWRTLIAEILAERTPVTKEQWTASLDAPRYEYPATVGRASTGVTA